MSAVELRTLTSHLSADTLAAQVDEQTRGGGSSGNGGSKKWIIIGAAAGGGVAAALILPNRSKPPTVGNITATPEQGLAASTSIAFSVDASDPNGKPLSYSWDFGDGSTGSGANLAGSYRDQDGPGTITGSAASGNRRHHHGKPAALLAVLVQRHGGQRRCLFYSN